MSLLCACASTKSANSTPSHTTSNSSSIMSKIKPPSTAGSTRRFGFGFRGSRNASQSKSQTNGDVSEQPTDPVDLSPRGSGSLNFGLALSPSALLNNSNNSSNFGGYVLRKGMPEGKRERPVSTISYMRQTESPPREPVPVRSYDDTNPTGKPKTGLRSFLSKSFYRGSQLSKSNSAKGSSDSVSSHQTGSQSSIPGLAAGKKGKAIKPSKLGRPSSPAGSVKTSKSLNSFGVSKAARPDSPNSTSTKSGQTIPNSRSSSSKLSKLAMRDSKGKNQYQSNSGLHNDSKHSSGMYKADSEVECRVIDSAANVSAAGVSAAEDMSTSRSRSGTALTSTSTNSQSSIRSSQSGFSLTERKKPMIEINPITKPDNQTDNVNSHKIGDYGIEKKDRKLSGSRSFTIDEEALNSILVEFTSLRNTVVELQHHLIGKQEYEEKIREELKLKNEMIQHLQHKLTHCTCNTSKDEIKVGIADITTAELGNS